MRHALLACCVWLNAGTASAQWSIDDYARIQRVSELTLSDCGERFLIASERRVVDGGDGVRVVYVGSVDGEPEPVDALSAGRAFTWISETELAFLAADARGKTQVHVFDISTRQAVTRTDAPDDVSSYAFSPDGRALAYVTQSRGSLLPPLFEQFRDGRTGIIADPNTLSVYDFVDPARLRAPWEPPPRAQLWVQYRGETRAVPIQGHVSAGQGGASFFWSDDSRYLSVNFVADGTTFSPRWSLRTSVGVYDMTRRRFRMVAASTVISGTATNFLGGEWLPGGHRILLQRWRDDDVWLSWSYPELGVFDVSAAHGMPRAWRGIETYTDFSDLYRTRFLPQPGGRLLLETTVAGTRGAYEITNDGLARAQEFSGLDGSISLVNYSRDSTARAFVRESLTNPPEVYLQDRPGGPVRVLTHFNDALRARILFEQRLVSWRSNDGVIVQGWLLVPRRSVGDNAPLPLLTYVHGGPSWAFPNTFAPTRRLWPYPLEALAESGIAVFVPNYRGTKTFGRQFASPTALDAEPIDDIVSGVQQLVSDGMADPRRLAIAGHSHGAWLGPMALGRSHLFQVASFAENSGSVVMQYDLMAGHLNSTVHPQSWGGSLYRTPQRYLELSPELHFEGVSSVMLFEGGAYNAAVMMLGYPKAAAESGNATEFIIYPASGHSLTNSALIRESAARNLDWFRFWLQDYEDPDPAKSEQYERWRRLRTRQCGSNNNARNAYCGAHQ